MVAAAAGGGPTRPPANIEDFLWNMHSVLAAQPGPLAIDSLKDAYSKHLGHKCAIERFLVVGEGGLSATLKRIPHIVSLISDNRSVLVKATQQAEITKQQLIDADAAYRRELIKKNAAAKAAAKAKAVAGKQPAVATAKATAAATPSAIEQSSAAKAAPAVAAAADAQGAKRPAEVQAAGGEAKKPRSGEGNNNDAETLARMLVQGVVRVLQNRQKAGKGPLPVTELEEEFKALWKVPFNLQQAGETDAVTFLQKWPNKVDICTNSDDVQVVQLSKKVAEKPKAATAPVKAASEVAAPAPAPAAAKTGVGAVATSTAVKAAAPAAAKAPMQVATKSGPAAVPKRAGGPTRPPASIEDFLWNLHTVIESHGPPMPIDQLKDAYSKHLGHKCAIERFLVVGEGGLAATFKRIPHIVSVVVEKDGSTVLKPTLPAGATKEALIAADHQYRKQIQQKNQAAKEAATKAGSPPAAAPTAAVPTSTTVAPAATAPPAAAPAATAVKAAPPAPTAASAPAPQKRAADGGGEPEAKKPRGEDADTLARMLVQGVVRVLQNRQREGQGPLPMANLEEEFKALWKVPFNLQQAGESDPVTFLQKWPNKVEVVTDKGQTAVQLAKKASEKAKPGTPAATKAAAPAVSAPPLAAKAGPPAASVPPAKPAAVATAPVPKATATAAIPAAAASPETAATTAAATAAAAAAVTTAPTAAHVSPAASNRTVAAVPAAKESSARGDSSPGAAAPTEVVPAVEAVRSDEGALRTMPAIQREATSMLAAMREMVRRQEALVSGLQQLSSGDAAL